MYGSSPRTGGLPLSSLRLLVPPLRLMSAWMWQVTEQRNIMHYGKLVEFVTLVTEMVPDLLSYKQKAQLILGLRARLVLELCYGGSPVETIQPHLNRISQSVEPHGVYRDPEVEAAAGNFVELVQTLLKNPDDREYYFQDVFPEQYGPEYDTALKILVWEFLSRLEQLLPVPDFKQTASWLGGDVSSVWEDSLQSVSNPEYLKALLQHHQCHGNLEKAHSCNSIMGDTILSTLSCPSTIRVVIGYEEANSVWSSSDENECVEDGVVKSSRPERDRDGSEGLFHKVGVEKEEVEGDECQNVERNDGEGITEFLEDIQSDNMNLSDPHIQPQEGEGLPALVTSPLPCTLASNGCQEVSPQKHGDDSPLKEMTSQRHMETASKTNRGLKVSLSTSTLSSETKVHAEPPLASTVLSSGQKKLEHTADISSQVLACNQGSFPAKEEVFLHQHTSKEDQEEDCRLLGFVGDGVEKSLPSSSTHEKSSEIEARSSAMQLYICSHCGKNLTNSSSLKRHKKIHSGERPFNCIKCGKNFIDAWDLTKHQRIHCSVHKTKSHSCCSQCGKTFTRSSDLTKHLVTHITARPFSCTECGKTYRFAGSLKRHQQIHSSGHKTKSLLGSVDVGAEQSSSPDEKSSEIEDLSATTRLYICSHCGKNLRNSSNLKRHEKIHTGERPFNCIQCGKNFITNSDLKKHQRIHNSVHKTMSHSCSQCGKNFTRSSDLTKHLVTHIEERPFSCTECGKSYRFAGSLKRHQQIHSSGYKSKSHSCSQCGKNFTCLSVLTQHLVIHTEERPFSCTECGKSYRFVANLKRHQIMHSSEQPYRCSYCGRGFVDRSRFKSHLRTHTGECPYRCSYCGKTFIQPGMLARHMPVHTGDRPYLCEKCGKSFFSSAELVLHTRTHTGERPYKCAQCGKGFRASCDLLLHRRTHTGERPHSCTYCKKRFISKDALTRHVRIHTGEKPYQCSQCGKRFSILHNMKVHQRVHKTY